MTNKREGLQGTSSVYLDMNLNVDMWWSKIEVCVKAVQTWKLTDGDRYGCVLVSGFAHVTMTDGVVSHLSVVPVYSDME